MHRASCILRSLSNGVTPRRRCGEMRGMKLDSPPGDPFKSEGDLNLSPLRKVWAAERLDAAARQWLEEDARYFLHQSLSTPCLNVLKGCHGSSIEDWQGRVFLGRWRTGRWAITRMRRIRWPARRDWPARPGTPGSSRLGMGAGPRNPSSLTTHCGPATLLFLGWGSTRTWGVGGSR